MKQFRSFFGEIVGRNDLDFVNDGNREAIVQTHNDFTDNLGGITRGMEVSISVDKKSLIVNPGSFYSAGSYSYQNNAGGGERGVLLQQTFFTGLPETPSIGTTPQYLLVYAKITKSNTDPNPLVSQQAVTSRNLQTGDNVPTREYPRAAIVVTNPGFKNSLLQVDGVPLALIQVDYSGTLKVSSDASIVIVDESVRRNYVLGTSVDLVSGQLLDSAFPDDIVTGRMFQDGSITSEKFSDNAVGSQKLSVWDETTAFNDTSGSGVANQHLKDDVVTLSKINYVSGVNNLGVRNHLVNSSFEVASGTTAFPANWDITAYASSAVSLVNFGSDSLAPKYGNQSIFVQGGTDGSNNALSVQVSQIVNMNDQLKNKPISAFFWARQTKTTDFTKTGTTGLHGTIEFLDGNTTPGVLSTESFGTISGVTTSEYLQFSTTTPAIFTGSQSCTKIRLTLGGNFDGNYYVDGVMLTESELIPSFDVNPSEYIMGGTIDFSQITGRVNSSQIASNAIDNSKIQAGAVTGIKIASQTITATNIQNGTITTAQLDPSIIFGVPSGFLIFTDNASAACPPTWTDVTSQWAGRLPIGYNPSSPNTELSVVGQDYGTAATDKDKVVEPNAPPDHAHDWIQAGSTFKYQPGFAELSNYTRSVNGGADVLKHGHKVPFRTVRVCRAP